MTPLIFALGLLTQTGLIAAPILLSGRMSVTTISLHRSVVYVLLAANYVAYLLISQVGFALASFQHRRGVSFPDGGGLEAGIRAQGMLLLALGGLVAGYLLMRTTGGGGRLRLPASPRLNLSAALVAGCIGTFASLKLFGGLAGIRSNLVASSQGKVLYALTFMLTFGAVLAAVIAWRRDRWLAAYASGFAASLPLAVLGGRGRILWLLLSIWLAGLSIRNRTVGIGRVLVLVVCFLLALFMLDAVLFLLVAPSASVAEILGRFTSAVPSLASSPGFDAFDNFALLTSERRGFFPTVLAGGSREYFMGLYFPTALASGVGFPISVFGELWLAGGTALLFLGSTLLGVAIGYLDSVLRDDAHELTYATVLCVAPWLTGVGSAYFEHTGKLVASVAPGVALMLVLVAAKGLRYRGMQ